MTEALTSAAPILRTTPDFSKRLKIRQCLNEEGGPKGPMPDDATLQKMMVQMLMAREVDLRLSSLHRTGDIGQYHPAPNEEALAVGSAAALKPQDWIAPGFRELAVALYRGMSLQQVFHNMYGTALDLAQGRPAPGRISDRAHNMLAVCGSVGAQITHAVGVAWAMKLKKDDAVAVAYFGEGATSESDFHNGMNFAGVYGAPVVLLCRNSQSTGAVSQTAATTIAQKGLAYGVRAERVDGQDVLAVYQATLEACEIARRGEGPTLIEVLTNSAQDPIPDFRAHLIERGLWDEDNVRAKHIALGIEEACQAAKQAGPPARSSLFEDVFESQSWMLREQDRGE